MAIAYNRSTRQSYFQLFEAYINDVRYEDFLQPFTADVGDVIKFIPIDPLRGFKPGWMDVTMRQNNQDVAYAFEIVDDRIAVLNVTEVEAAGYFRSASYRLSAYTPPVVVPEKAPFTIPESDADAVRTKASILVNDVVKTGAVTVGIDQTLKFKANEGYKVSYAIIIFNDETQPNGLQELEMTLSLGDTVASLKNDMLSSEWTFNSILFATEEIPIIPEEPEKAPFTIPDAQATAIRNKNISIFVDTLPQASAVTVGIDQTLKFVANPGYSLEYGYVNFIDPDSPNGFQELEMVLSEDSSELTLKNDMLSSKWTFSGVLVSSKVIPLHEHTFTAADISLITNRMSTIYLDGVQKTSSFIAKENQTVTIKTNEGYKFSSLPVLGFQHSTVVGGQIIYENIFLPFDRISDTEAEIVIGDYSIYYNYLGVDLGVEEIILPYTFTITENDINRAIANKATIYVEGEIITTDTVVNRGEEVKLVANPGWEFYERQGPNSVRIQYVDQIFGGFLYQEFVLSPLGKEAVYIVEPLGVSGYEYDRILIQTRQTAIDVSGTNNVYLATDKTIRDVNNERYRTRLVTANEKTEIEFFDYGDFILNIIDLPFSLEDKVLENEFINLGDRTLQTQAPVVATDNVVIDMGTINILGEGDSLDYQDVQTILHLPWLSKVLVDSSYVINQTISIEYHVDMYTGDAVANIYSTAVDNGEKVFLTTTGTVGTNIPFAGYKFYINTPDNKGINTTANNNLSKAYIEVIKPDAPFKDEFFNASVSDAGVLSNESGYIEISNANLQFKALHTEKLDIINILRNGIIV